MDEGRFSYRVMKGGRVFVRWNGRQVSVLKGVLAQKLIGELPRLDSEREQLALAQVTGNYKRDNER
jgi:hypothetical protein